MTAAIFPLESPNIRPMRGQLDNRGPMRHNSSGSDTASCRARMHSNKLRKPLLAWVAILVVLSAGHGMAQPPEKSAAGSAAAAGEIADFFGQMGDRIYSDCIFELSQEQLEVQQALIEAYISKAPPARSPDNWR